MHWFVPVACVTLTLSACSHAPPEDLAPLVADQGFAARVEHPAYTTSHPHVTIDQAHNNYHTMSGRYGPFAELLTLDGYRVSSNETPFTSTSLRAVDVLVIANARGGATERDPDSIFALPAFTDVEIEAVREWVAGGGALLLVADHAPSGAAAHALAAVFDVEMRNTWTFDSEHGEPGFGAYNIAFERATGSLADHAITRGRNADERLNRVVTFTGQSLAGPRHSSPLLVLSPTAMDEDVTETIRVSAAGRVQGLAQSVGSGRLVVLGEAAMLTAQERMRNGELRRYGISYAQSDNQQFVLNVLHWLSGLLN